MYSLWTLLFVFTGAQVVSSSIPPSYPSIFLPTYFYRRKSGDFYRSLDFIREELPLPGSNATRLVLLGNYTSSPYIRALLQKSISDDKSNVQNYEASINSITRAIRRAIAYCTAKRSYNQTGFKHTELHNIDTIGRYIRDNTRYKRAPCGALDILAVGVLQENELKLHDFKILVPKKYDIVLVIHTFISGHNIVTKYVDYGEYCVQNRLYIWLGETKIRSGREYLHICSSHIPTTHYLLSYLADIMLYDYYSVENLYLSMSYAIEDANIVIERRKQFINANFSTTNKKMMPTHQHVLTDVRFLDLFSFHILAELLENVNVYLYRLPSCDALFALYKILDGPIVVQEAYVCEKSQQIGPFYEDTNGTTNLFFTYLGKSSFVKVCILRSWLVGHVIHFTFNTSIVNAVPVHMSADDPLYGMSVSSDRDKIYHKVWQFSSDTFLTFTKSAVRAFKGLDGACFYGGFAVRTLSYGKVSLQIL